MWPDNFEEVSNIPSQFTCTAILNHAPLTACYYRASHPFVLAHLLCKRNENMNIIQIFVFLLRNLTVNKCVNISRVVLILLDGLCSMQPGLELSSSSLIFGLFKDKTCF